MTALTKTQQKQLQKALNAIDLARADVDEIKSHLEDSFERLSERAQEGEKGEAFQEAIEILADFVDGLENEIQGAGNLIELD